jgi:CRISPR-associated protein Cas2
VPDAAARWHFVCYDIAHPRRLARVHRLLSGVGLPLQYSVFLVRANKPGLLQLLDALMALIDARADDLRVYPLPSRPRIWCYGRAVMPDGLWLLGEALPPGLFDDPA